MRGDIFGAEPCCRQLSGKLGEAGRLCKAQGRLAQAEKPPNPAARPNQVRPTCLVSTLFQNACCRHAWFCYWLLFLLEVSVIYAGQLVSYCRDFSCLLKFMCATLVSSQSIKATVMRMEQVRRGHMAVALRFQGAAAKGYRRRRVHLSPLLVKSCKASGKQEALCMMASLFWQGCFGDRGDSRACGAIGTRQECTGCACNQPVGGETPHSSCSIWKPHSSFHGPKFHNFTAARDWCLRGRVF